MYTCLSGFIDQCESIEEVRALHTLTLPNYPLMLWGGGQGPRPHLQGGVGEVVLSAVTEPAQACQQVHSTC